MFDPQPFELKIVGVTQKVFQTPSCTWRLLKGLGLRPAGQTFCRPAKHHLADPSRRGLAFKEPFAGQPSMFQQIGARYFRCTNAKQCLPNNTLGFAPSTPEAGQMTTPPCETYARLHQISWPRCIPCHVPFRHRALLLPKGAIITMKVPPFEGRQTGPPIWIPQTIQKGILVATLSPPGNSGHHFGIHTHQALVRLFPIKILVTLQAGRGCRRFPGPLAQSTDPMPLLKNLRRSPQQIATIGRTDRKNLAASCFQGNSPKRSADSGRNLFAQFQLKPPAEAI